MARSGQTDFTVTANTIVTRAIAICSERSSDIPLDNNEITDGLVVLNMYVKFLASEGLHLWTREEGVLFLDTGTSSYKLGPTGAKACRASEFENTAITTAAVALDTDLVVDSVTGMAGAPDIFSANQAAILSAWTATLATLAVASDKLTVTNSGAAAGYAELALTGLTVGNNYRFSYGYEVGTSTTATFSVISDSVTLVTSTESVTGSYTFDFVATQTTATFRAANVSTTTGHTTLVTAANYVDQATGDWVGIRLDDLTRQWLRIVSISGTTLSLNGTITSAAAIANTVFSFGTLIGRPLRIESARRATIGDNTEVQLDKWARQEYFAQTNKTSQGTPTSFYYDPQLDDGVVHIWQTASSTNQLVKFTYQRALENFDTSANNPDFPIEWALPLVWNVAAMLGYEYDTPLSKMQMIEAKAGLMQQTILGFDEEMTSFSIQPDFT